MARKAPAKTKPKTVDEYLAGVSDDKRAALEKVRKTVTAVVPRAGECISYGLPAFQVDGKVFFWFGAGARHCAIYGIDARHKGELAGYDLGDKGTLRFQPDNPLPAALLRKLVKSRLAKRMRTMETP